MSKYCSERKGGNGVVHRIGRPAAAVCAAGALAMGWAGCEMSGYLAEQSWGQLRVLAGRERIVPMLQRGDLDEDHRRKLQLVLLARDYGFSQLGLKRTGAYALYYDTGGKPIAFNLSAAARDALRPKVWTFPVVGRLPYLGFFRRERGVRMQRSLQRAGFDTYLRPVTAYSSLGWFADPVFSSLLDGRPWRLIEVVLHETTHTTVFLRGELGFNESLAVFVGQQGTLDFLAQRFGPNSPLVGGARQSFARRRRFAQLIEQLYARLQRLYARKLSRIHCDRGRERIFAWAKHRFREVFPDRPQHRFLRMRLNNAVVLSYGRYLQGLRFHQQAYRCLGNRLDRFIALYRYAQHFDKPIEIVARRCGLNATLPQAM